MFGIGLPELILIMALALIVVGPEKLPDLAKTLARQLLELKKVASSLQDSLKDDSDSKPWEHIPPGEFSPPVIPPGGEEDEAWGRPDMSRVSDLAPSESDKEGVTAQETEEGTSEAAADDENNGVSPPR